MLRNTFQHIPKIGPVTEWQLWESGILSWDEALDGGIERAALRKRLVQGIVESLERLELEDARWFGDRLPPGECWRLFPEFRDSVAYIDIETTGTSLDWGGEITTIALWDGSELRSYVNGENLRDFQDDILDYKLLVTYNGKPFDVPIIESWFNTTLPHAHIDLRFVLGSLGIRGGLKGCEKQFGLDRGELDGVDGYYAVLFWREYCRTGSPQALETLLAYNALDVVNLERLMLEAYNLKVEETPFALTHPLEIPETTVTIPFTPDTATVERAREYMIGRFYGGNMSGETPSSSGPWI